jgi:hypothetical protein
LKGVGFSRAEKENIPPGLKPIPFFFSDGTDESVPFQNIVLDSTAHGTTAVRGFSSFLFNGKVLVRWV